MIATTITEVFMRSRLVLLTLSLYLALALIGCSKPSADNTTDTGTPADTTAKDSKVAKEAKEPKEARGKKEEPVIVPAGTSVTVSLGSALGSKLSQPGQTFTGTVAKDVTVGNEVVIPKGLTVAGTVTDAKALGKFKGGAVLNIRLDAINLNGYDLPVQTAARSFTEKGKGKRTAVLTGGGAALGGIIGALAGGGKGAGIGAIAGGGAGLLYDQATRNKRR
jgi:outer membrane lipoprotein SlyB